MQDEQWILNHHSWLAKKAIEEAQMFDIPVPWNFLRNRIEKCIEYQNDLEKQINEKNGCGLLQLCRMGAADWYLFVNEAFREYVTTHQSTSKRPPINLSDELPKKKIKK